MGDGSAVTSDSLLKQKSGRLNVNAHADLWDIPSGLTYLNHGSYGLSPRVVQEHRARLSAELGQNPMAFFGRRQETLLQKATSVLAEFIGCREENLVMLDNATTGMNVVATNIPLSAGDEVLITNHAYGAVVRTWQRACQGADAMLVTASVPFPPESDDQVIESIASSITSRTRILVVSHVSSMTATILPVAGICAEAERRGIATCIDGPHAPAHVPLDVSSIGCDYYVASCHKWLCAPLGTGFLYAREPAEPPLEPLVMSWGRVQPAVPEIWREEFWWSGTRDLAAYLTVPTAIEFMRSHGLADFRKLTHDLAMYACERVSRVTQCEPFLPERDDWFGSMMPLPLPDCDTATLMHTLAATHSIEVPAYRWEGRPILRVSCHLYNDREQIDRLANAMSELLS
ncbi:MAG: aminotransferase class V-fold PLP-dependent enzyme [Pirellulales bacterium]|nr:aminotransferase class V-fold PLP-dependent enzyme [Pirellulales bacterium]